MHRPASLVFPAACLSLALGACANNTADEPPIPAPVPDNPVVEPECPLVAGATIELTTSDGVSLIADHYTAGEKGRKAIVLLHMIPPHHDKSNYTPEFIAALGDAGYDVLNVNRRGAPGSSGDPVEAYEGPQGKLDAIAGVRYLLDHPCAPAADTLVLVGASNGTTTVLDYTVAAAADDLPRPRALVFLSGGSYTENQNPLAEQAAVLGDAPIYFAYPTAEAEWNVALKADASPQWTFREFSPGSHGTKLFASDPGIIPALVAWLGSLDSADSLD